MRGKLESNNTLKRVFNNEINHIGEKLPPISKRVTLYMWINLPPIEMVVKKTRYFDIETTNEGFVSKLKREKKEYNFSDLKTLRNILTNEKARILSTLKTKEPESIYQLAKYLKRDLKSVRTDMKILERFGFIEYISKRNGKRISHKPVLSVDRMEFILRF